MDGHSIHTSDTDESQLAIIGFGCFGCLSDLSLFIDRMAN
jgi:hypothetical protein